MFHPLLSGHNHDTVGFHYRLYKGFHGAATTSLADATNFNGSTRGIIAVGSLGTTDTNVGVNTTIDGAASASKKIYIKAGSTSVSNAATGIQTATSGSYHITSTATVTDGYQAAGTKTVLKTL